MRTKQLIFAGLSLMCSACAGTQTNQLAKAKRAPEPITQPSRAKNVILFIGDGMGISTITAARIYDGQSRGETGEENLLSFEHFPQVALVKTYNTNQQVPDSAGTASAMNIGVKTRAGVIGIGPEAHRGDCGEAQTDVLPNIAEQAHMAGKAVGIVSTMRITHATPAAVYAHAPERDWESDGDIPAAERAKGCQDIATQLVNFPFDAALGGGTEEFRGTARGGKRLDPQADLVADWRARTGGTYVDTANGLAAASPGDRPLLGMFTKSHMTYMLERKPGTSEPTLSQMTAAAIAKVSRNPNGYFLMVEGGNIDHGHHEGRADIALSETQEFARAVQVALDKVDLSNTLILVTADHSHVFTIAGYPTRGNPILGLVKSNDGRGEPMTTPVLATDGFPYTALGYQNGPGATPGKARSMPATQTGSLQQALVPTGDIFGGTHNLAETHGGEDVALYATGPGAERAHGVIEQNFIFQIIMRALGLKKKD